VGKDVGILGDLQGPKIRIEKFSGGKVTLREGHAFILDAELPDDAGTVKSVGISYKALPQDVKPDDLLVLGDGEISLRVEQVQGARILCRVENGGELSDHKGINRQGGGLSAEALTDKDRRDVKLAAELQVDYLAVSFPRDAPTSNRLAHCCATPAARPASSPRSSVPRPLATWTASSRPAMR